MAYTKHEKSPSRRCLFVQAMITRHQHTPSPPQAAATHRITKYHYKSDLTTTDAFSFCH